MSFLNQPDPFTLLSARRTFLGRSGLLLSGAAVALLAGQDALAAKGDKAANANERANLIAYLKQASASPECKQ